MGNAMGVLKKNRAAALVAVAASVGIAVGCGGSSTGGGVGDYSGTQFVSDETTTGRVVLELTEDVIPVGSTAGFRFHVLDSNGDGVPSTSVACDSENGVALIEPTLGREMTDSNGQISGVWGCENPGSYLIGCRVATGGNKREFATIRCTGDVPVGFTGFPGAGGGGLGTGGGAVDPEDGGPGKPDGLVRITEVEVFNVEGETDAVPEIDLTPTLCDGGDTPTDTSDDTYDPWGDDEGILTIQNDSERTINFNGFSYVVKGGQADGSDYRSDLIRDYVQAPARGESTVTLRAAIFKGNITGFKTYDRNGATIPFAGGRKNVQFTAYGVDDRGDPVRISTTVSMAFDHYNNCS
jgi:hypothetical protein